MRQRYLLGRRNRQRYVEQYKLLDKSFNPNQILAICTPVGRVIQSTYSEFLGLYPYVDTQAVQEEKSLPSLKVRGNVLQGTLKATIDGYTMLPVYNYINQDIYDDVSWQSCDYVVEDRSTKYSNESSFLSVSPYILEVMREPIAKAFNLTPSQEKNMLYT